MLSKRSQKLKNQSKPTLRQSKLPKDVIFDDDSDSSDDDDEATLGSFRNSLEKKLLVQHERDDVFKDDDVNEDEDDSEDEDTDESTTEAEEKKAGDSVSLVNKAINAKIEDFKASLDSLKRKNEDDVGQSDNDPDENNGGSGESDNDYDDEEEDSESSDNMEEESEEETKLAPHQAKKRKLAKMEASKKKVQRFSDGDNNKDGTIQSDEEETRQTIRNELKSMSIEELQKMKERIGLKQFKKVLDKDGPNMKKKPIKKEAFKRENKNRPREMSSKKAVGRFRDVVGVSSDLNQKVKEKRDPRFDSLCGEFNDELFKKSYKFVDDIRAKERVQLKEELKVETDQERIEQIKYLIQRYDNQMREKKLLESRKAAKDEEREKNKELVQSGNKPIYRNKMENKNKELVEKFEGLKKSGGLDKYIKSKTKKNFVKDRKKFGNMK